MAKVIYFILFFQIIFFLETEEFKPGSRVMVKMRDYYQGVVVGKEGELYRIKYIQYSGPKNLVEPDKLILLKNEWEVGEWTLVDWTNERKFIKVEVIYKHKDQFLCMNWPQTEGKWFYFDALAPLEYAEKLGNNYDATMNYKRPYENPDEPDNTDVEVEWQDRWYPAEILKSEGDKSYIHYKGFGSSWDEWVAGERIRILSADSAWNIGDKVWSNFTNEGKYNQVLIIEKCQGEYFCLRFPQLDFRWKSTSELFRDKPEQTFYPGK